MMLKSIFLLKPKFIRENKHVKFIGFGPAQHARPVRQAQPV
jgi:hypothetical protein